MNKLEKELINEDKLFLNAMNLKWINLSLIFFSI
jgi:hypothetical protein